MGRLKWLGAVLVLVAACGGGGTTAADLNYGPPSVAGQVEKVGDTFFAPDFTVILSDGSTFNTAEIDTPLYVMFWAEW
jgi:hypothetical protein